MEAARQRSPGSVTSCDAQATWGAVRRTATTLDSGYVVADVRAAYTDVRAAYTDVRHVRCAPHGPHGRPREGAHHLMPRGGRGFLNRATLSGAPHRAPMLWKLDSGYFVRSGAPHRGGMM